MRPQDLTTAKTVAKISVVSNTAGGKKSLARRSTGLDYSSRGCQQSASNLASRSLASHVLAIEASAVYLRRCDVKAGHAGK